MAAQGGSQRVKILLVSDSYPPLIGGGTRATQLLARELSRRGHLVTVATVAQEGAAARELDEGVDVHRLTGLTFRLRRLSADRTRVTPPPFPDPELIWRLRRLLAARQPDLVHAYGWIAHSCALALRGRPEPLVLSARDYGNVCALRTLYRHDRQCEGPAPVKCLRCARRAYGTPKGALAVAGVAVGKRLVRRRVGAVHSVSTFVETVVDRFLMPLSTVHHAVVPDFAEALDASGVDETFDGLLPREPFILFVGALRKVKGVEALLAAYARLEQPPPLVLIGPPAPDEPVRYPDGVTVIRGAPFSAVLHAWDRSLFGVAPSLWAEPLGNVVHEGMSRGRAVIGTYPGGHTDMIDPGETGLLVPAGDVDALTQAMQLLIGDAALRERLGAAARGHTEAYTASSVVPRFEELYESVLGAARPPRRVSLATVDTGDG
jgi:glycosyltransferase involved in cell wall biosynthesis